jgi:hypothetical protein
MNSKRAGTLFALTLTAGTLGVAGSASAATCGTPALDAVHRTVNHPASSHVEVLWTRTVVDTPARAAYDDPDVVVPDSYRTDTKVITEAWDEKKVVTEAYEEKVIDQAAKDAVYRTVYLWRHKVTHEERWEPVDWNGASTRTSWLIVPGQNHEELVSEALPEISHIVQHEAVVEIIHHDAVTEDVQVLVPGYTITGQHHDAVAEVSHVEQRWAAQAPGSDWADSGESRVVVDKAAWDESVLVTPAKPAGPACPTKPDGDDGGPGGGTGGGTGADGHEEHAQPGGGGTAPVRTASHAASRVTAQQASALPARLAYTGSDTTPYALVGVFLLAGGVALTVGARRLQGQRVEG